jgi:hypothetical protein
MLNLIRQSHLAVAGFGFIGLGTVLQILRSILLLRRGNRGTRFQAYDDQEMPVTYTFRIRFNRSPATTILTEAPEIQIPAPEAGVSLALRATSGKSLKDEERWALVGEGYKSEKDARDAGSRMQDILVIVFAKLRIGANFGNRSPIHGQYAKTLFTQVGLLQTQQLLGDERHLNDEPGLSVYSSYPKPKFIAYAPPVAIAKNPDNVQNTFISGLKQGRPLTDRERIASELFFASFFQSSPDVRFLLLVMAVEALIEKRPKSKEAVAYVDNFVTQIKSSNIAEPKNLRSLAVWITFFDMKLSTKAENVLQNAY